MPLVRPSRLHQSELFGFDRSLGAVTDPQLVKDIGQMIEVFFDRTDSQEQFLGNLLVGQAGGDVAEQFQFAVDERVN